MSEVPVPRRHRRDSLTATCALATATVLVCGFLAPSVQEPTARADTHVVALTARSQPVPIPPEVLVDALADAAAADAATVLPLEESAVMAEATLGDLQLASRLISLALQPLVWLVNAAPASLKPIFGGFLLVVTPIAAFVGAAIDAVLDPILRLFGIGIPIPDPPATESVLRSEDTSPSGEAEPGMRSGRTRAEVTQDRITVPDVPDVGEATDAEEAAEVADTTTLDEVGETADSEEDQKVEERADPDVATEPEMDVELEEATDTEEEAELEESTATDESVSPTTTAAEPSDEEPAAA